MLRTWVLTVFTETDSSLAISGLDRLVGRYRSTLSSVGLSSCAGGDENWPLAARDEPCTTSRMSAEARREPSHAAAAPPAARLSPSSRTAGTPARAPRGPRGV